MIDAAAMPTTHAPTHLEPQGSPLVVHDPRYASNGARGPGSRHDATVADSPVSLAPSEATIARFAESSIRSLLLLNGLAGVAVLTFAGQAPKDLASNIAPALGAFGWGAVLAILAAAAAYLSHALFADRSAEYERRCYGGSLRIISLTAGFTSICAFLYGLTVASRALG